MSDPLRFLEEALGELERRHQLRSPPGSAEIAGRPAIELCSNDYLGLGASPWPGPHASVRSGAGASALLGGYHQEHVLAEQALADFVGAESALMFSSGYAANVGLISSLVGEGDLVVSDALNHASIVDGCRLSRASVRVVPHRDLVALELALADGARFRRRLVVTESYFSMDGDFADLRALRAICSEKDAIFAVDEAHALGVFGPEGGGLCAAAGIQADVLVGTLGKAIGLHGAFVAGSLQLRQWLWNRARSYVFSTAMSPVLAAAVPERVALVRSMDAARGRLAAVGAELRTGLAAAGVTIPGEGPILPWILGEESRAELAASAAHSRGVLIHCVRPPTVPRGTSRLRIVASARLSAGDLELACSVLSDVARTCCT